MRGTLYPVNRALNRPLLIAGVEKRLFMANSLLSFPLVAATRLHFPSCLLGVVFFVVMHVLFKVISQHDPQVATLFKRSTRYSVQSYFPATSHPAMTDTWSVNTVARLK